MSVAAVSPNSYGYAAPVSQQPRFGFAGTAPASPYQAAADQFVKLMSEQGEDGQTRTFSETFSKAGQLIKKVLLWGPLLVLGWNVLSWFAGKTGITGSGKPAPEPSRN